MRKQFDAQAERHYYRRAPTYWKESSLRFSETLMYCTAGQNWRDFFVGKTILELGAGECQYVSSLIIEGNPLRYIASDIFEDRYSAARQALAGKFSELEFRTLRAEAIQMPARSVDTVLAFGLYHHLPGRENAFKEVNRILKPGGSIVFRDPYAGNPAICIKYFLAKKSLNEWPVTVFSTKRLLKKANFSVERISRFWLRFPLLPGGLWSTNVGFVAKKPND